MWGLIPKYNSQDPGREKTKYDHKQRVPLFIPY